MDLIIHQYRSSHTLGTVIQQVVLRITAVQRDVCGPVNKEEHGILGGLRMVGDPFVHGQ